MSSDEISKILNMVKEGKITVEEGEKLILALITSNTQGKNKKAKALRIMAVKNGRKANIRIPLFFIRLWLKFRPDEVLRIDIGGEKVEIPVRQIIEEIESGSKELMEVETDEGKYAKIWIE